MIKLIKCYIAAQQTHVQDPSIPTPTQKMVKDAKLAAARRARYAAERSIIRYGFGPSGWPVPVPKCNLLSRVRGEVG